jgi:hypothetical protein
MAGAKLAAETFADFGYLDKCTLGTGIHLFYRRREDEVNAHPGTEFHIVRDWTRVAIIIIAAVELNRIDEKAHDHTSVLAASGFDQSPMASMKGAHGWHEPHSPAGCSDGC